MENHASPRNQITARMAPRQMCQMIMFSVHPTLMRYIHGSNLKMLNKCKQSKQQIANVHVGISFVFKSSLSKIFEIYFRGCEYNHLES